jgi:serine/threonine protein kinase
LFALKKLKSANLRVFKNEVEILARLNNCQDPHLVKLLLTMHITKAKGPPGKRSRFYLMFPLADGNLRQFWEHNLEFLDAEGTTPAAFPRWVARQFHGLAIALGKLHDLNKREGPGPPTHQDDRQPSTKDPSYGIHRDIKPENMLWYRTWVGPSPAAPADQEHLGLTQPAGSPDYEPHGVIQLADFGISSLHHTRTRSDVRLRKATKTYAPPEVELVDHPCSRSFDIWSLGCVFLEFMCWLVQGGSGSENPVDAFQKARYLEEKNTSLWGTLQDTFYVVTDKDKLRFDVNPAVKEVRHPQLHLVMYGQDKG